MKFDVFFSSLFILTIVRNVSLYNTFHNNLIVDTFNKRPYKNTVVSSLALQFGLCKLASTIDGLGKQEIMKALGYTNNKQIIECYNSTKTIITMYQVTDLVFVNTLYVNYTLDVDEKVINGSKENFGIDINKVGFEFPRAAVNFINREITQVTFRRLRDVLTMYDVHNDTSMLFVTAAHIKPTWEMHFELQNTKDRQFHTANNRIVYVPMMTYHGSSLYYENHNCKYFLVYMGGYGVTMAFMLPTAMQGINGFLTDIQRYPNLIKDARRNMEWKEINLIFPKFKIKNSLNLTSALNKTGITEILKKNTTCLKKMLKKDNLQPTYLSGVKQSIFIDVDEFGVFRNLAKGPSSHRNPNEKMMFDVVLDKPFYFSINMEISLVARGKRDDPYYELFSGVYHGAE